MIETISDPNRPMLEQRGALLLAQWLTELASTQRRVVLAVPGGRSVSGILSLLAERQDLPWKKIHLFMVDERIVAIDHPDSNFKLVNEILIAPLVAAQALPATNIHPFIVDSDRPDRGIAAYQEALERVGGRYDILLVSAGEDGHIGALYPNHHSVRTTVPYFLVMDDSPKPPPERMTGSKKLLGHAQRGLLLFFGNSKSTAYRNFLSPELTITDCPAKIINEVEESCVLTDINL